VVLLTVTFSLYNDLEKINYEIEIFIFFCPENSAAIKKLTNEIFTLFKNFGSEKQFDFETIKKVQLNFNNAFRKAHNEILHITTTKALERYTTKD